MTLTRSLVDRLAAEYAAEEPLAAVEDEHLEMLPGAFTSGNFGWRDAEWVVQWYYRRHLGAYPNRDRRAREAAYRENDSEAVRDAIETAATADDLDDRLDALTDLGGVDLPVASAFLHYLSPNRYVVVGPREWHALRDAVDDASDALTESYPDPPSPAEYRNYLDTVRTLADDLDVDLQTLHRALWRYGDDE